MTTLLDAPVVPQISEKDRAERLSAAGAAWSDRIDKNRSSAQLTYRVEGRGEGAVATRLRAGKHEFVIDEPAALAGPETQERYEQLRDAVDVNCPVLDLFANATPVSVTVAKA